MDYYGTVDTKMDKNLSSSVSSLLEWTLSQSAYRDEDSFALLTSLSTTTLATPTLISITSSLSSTSLPISSTSSSSSSSAAAASSFSSSSASESLSFDTLAIIISGMNSSNEMGLGYDFNTHIDEQIIGNNRHRTAYKFAVLIILSVLTVATIVGNVFVIAAILLERALRTAGNYLVLSLALADLMVAALVMPLGAVVEIQQEWTLGSLLCNLWTSADVLCCTASILHLLAIALDRYWAVTNVDYIHRRTPARIGIMILAVWTAAAVVSIAPLFGLKDADFEKRIQVEKRCLLSQDVGYQVFATISSFYGPLIFILLLYWKIFQVARKRIRHKPGGHKRTTIAITPTPSEVNAKLLDLKNERSLIGNRKRLLAPAKNKVKKSSTSLLSVEKSSKISKISLDNRSSTIQIDYSICHSDISDTLVVNHCDKACGMADKPMSDHYQTIETLTITGRPVTTMMIMPADKTSGDNNLLSDCRNDDNNSNNCNNRQNGSGAIHITNVDNTPIVIHDNNNENNSNSTNNNNNNNNNENSNNSIGVNKSNSNNNNNNNNNNNSIVLDCSLLIDKLNSKERSITMIKTSQDETMTMSANTPTVRSYLKGRSSSISAPVADLKQNNRQLCEKIKSTNGNAHQKSNRSGLSLLRKSPTASFLASGGSTRNGSHIENGNSTSGRSSSRAPRESLESKRERKAAKILAIITGIFVICWLPFFVIALLMPLCRACEPSKLVFSIFLWLGYLNSLLNPIIYTIFSPDFRRGFRRILCGRSSVG